MLNECTNQIKNFYGPDVYDKKKLSIVKCLHQEFEVTSLSF